MVPTSTAGTTEIQLQMHLYNRNEEAFRQGNVPNDQIGTIEQFEQCGSYVPGTFLAGIGGLAGLLARCTAADLTEAVQAQLM